MITKNKLKKKRKFGNHSNQCSGEKVYLYGI